MPKIKTTFTAEFTTKLGKIPVEFKLPVDLTQYTASEIADLINEVTTQASDHLTDLAHDAKVKFKNQGDFKKAYKAFAKTQEQSQAQDA
jgi:hypothetical protein